MPIILALKGTKAQGYEFEANHWTRVSLLQ